MLTKYLYRKMAVAAVTALGCASASAATPTLGEVLKASNISVTGYVDTSYTYLSEGGMFTSGVPNRVFDRERDSFNLHAVDVAIGYQPASGFGAFVQLDAGTDADVFGAVGSTSGDNFDVQEAYLQWTSGPLTIIGGKFATSAGAEVIESPSNLNFSRSILFGYAIPFTHTGMRATYAVSDRFKLIGGINNGWDVIKDSLSIAADGKVADGKTLEIGVSANPTSALSFSAMLHSGDEPGATVGTRDLIDIVATLSVTDSLSFTLNFDMAEQEDALPAGDAEWNGIAAYANFKLNNLWRAALRAEMFDDEDGFRTGVEQKWKELTLTVAHTPSANVELRGEIRYDKSDEDAFLGPNPLGGALNANDSQYGFGLEAIYKF